MYLLHNPILPYEWGSRTALARVRGETGLSASCEAELWMGAHDKAPSKVQKDGTLVTLPELIAGDPHGHLGPNLMAHFGPRLPFLLKVLAVERPLSLQVHPSQAQAEAGFDSENAAHIPIGAPNRNYGDRNHKPELLCARTAFDAFCGFRPIAESVALYDELGVSKMSPLFRILQGSDDADSLRQFVGGLTSLRDAEERRPLIRQLLRECERIGSQERMFAAECRWAVRVGALYPDDVGVVLMLLLDRVHLEPGEAVYVGPGCLHMYVQGVGVEIMASSDNVLRGGLTPKYVNCAEFLRILDLTTRGAQRIRPEQRGCERRYETPTPEFRLSSWEFPTRGEFRFADREGPEIVLAVDGEFKLFSSKGQEPMALRRGAAIFVRADDGPYTLVGSGSAYRATLGSLAMR